MFVLYCSRLCVTHLAPLAIEPQSQKGWCTGTSVIKYRLEVAVKKKAGHKPPPCCAACY
jgi:hypothetical protein